MFLDEAVEKFGSQSEVARICGLKNNAPSAWKSRNGGRIPKNHSIRLGELPSPTIRWLCYNCNHEWNAYIKISCPNCKCKVDVEKIND